MLRGSFFRGYGWLVGLWFVVHSDAGDWPQFLGPTRNGIANETNLAKTWPPAGPPVRWRKKVGEGFSGPIVSGQRLILFHRLGDRETIEARDVATGGQAWATGYAVNYRDDFGFDAGPRATPAIRDGAVYAFGVQGVLSCVDLQTGTVKWRVDTQKDFGARKGFFGIACSPLVTENEVWVNVGGTGNAGIIAFDKSSGKVLWQGVSDEASYSSPVPANLAGRDAIVFVTRNQLVLVERQPPAVYLEYPWRPPMSASVTAATPLIVSNLIFISASYGLGAAVLRVVPGRVEKVWSGDDILSNHYATSVQAGGFLYGFDGRQEQGCTLRCVEFATGKVRWSKDGLVAGTLTVASDGLYVLTEKGLLIRAELNPAKWVVQAQAQVMPFGVRAHPALAGGRLYARSKDELWSIDLRTP